MGCLPAADKTEFARQTFEDLPLAAADPPPLANLTVTNDDVEVTAENKIGACAQRCDPVEDPVHGPDVSVFSCGTVNAEHPQGAAVCQPRTANPAPNNPAVESSNRERLDRAGSGKEGAAPAATLDGPPDQGIPIARAKCLVGTLFRRPALLPED
jgi:hypothetical protein